MSEPLNLTPEQRQAITQPALTIVERARALVVNTDEDYQQCGDELKSIKAAQKELAARKATLTDPVNATLRAIRNLFTGPEASLDEAERIYKRGRLTYEQKLEDERKEAQRKLDEAAARERAKAEREAERLRQEAQAAEAAGNLEKANRLANRADIKQDQAASTVAPTVQKEPPRTAGISTREVWSAVVLSRKELIDAVAAGKVPEMALEPNMKFLNAQARACKKELAYPGVRAVVDKTVAAGSR